MLDRAGEAQRPVVTLAAPKAVPLFTSGREAFRAAAAHERDFGRYGLWLPVFMALGVALAVAVPFNPNGWALAAVVGLAGALTAVARRRSALVSLAGPSAALSACALGALLLVLEASLVGTPMLEWPQSATLEGTVTASEAKGTGRRRIIVRVEESTLRGAVPTAVRLTVAADKAPPVGARIRTKARLFPLHGPAIPGGYDGARRLYFDGIGASGYTYGAPTVLTLPGRFHGPALVHRVRDGIEARLSEAMDAKTASVAAALLVGRRGAMSPQDTEALRASGLGHILAISGLHMALVAGSVFAAVRLLLALVPGFALSQPIRKWAALAGLLAATVYLVLSGGAVATVRAYVMLSIALLAILADRPALSMRTVAIAAVVVMVMDPVSVVEPGFQMSFLAVVALVGAYEWWAGRRGNRTSGFVRTVVGFVVGLAATSLIAGIATGPVAAYHFHRVAPLGLVANLAAMPILTFVAMPAGVISLLLMPFGLEGPFLSAMALGLQGILAVAHTVAGWSSGWGTVGAIPAASALLFAGGVLWLAIFTAWWRLFGFVAVAAGLALAPFGPRYDVMVSDDGKTIAARAPDGRLAIQGKRDGFAAQTMLKADGTPPQANAGAGGLCDPLGCTLPLNTGHLAITLKSSALAEDCQLADVVVTRHAVDRCAAPLLIDRRQLRRRGAVAAKHTPGGWEVVHARPRGSTRPWHVRAYVER
ncbi:MAG: ComEC/Rec2 family competence protein [Pseudomonadota bacterium]